MNSGDMARRCGDRGKQWQGGKWIMATWPGTGTGLPLQGNVCAVTWEGSGKAVKAHRRVLCRDGPCFAHVLKPSKWSMATWPGHGKGLPLQGNVFAVTWEGSGKGFGVWWTVQAEVLAGQSRTPAAIPGAAPPGPRLGRGRRIFVSGAWNGS